LGTVRILPAGDTGMVVEFGESVDPATNRMVHQFCTSFASLAAPGVSEVVPTYRSALIYYDPLVTSWEDIASRVTGVLAEAHTSLPARPRVMEIPTAYGGDRGPDLEYVARYTGLEPDEVIGLHSAPRYLVYMIGFTPGYPYFGGLDERLVVPRLKNPRLRTPAGAVGIGGNQTGIYTIPSPGGFHIIGQTPLRLFDPTSDRPFLLKAGWLVRFRPVGSEEYERIERAISDGHYTPQVHEEREGSQS
jgi:inhibitor of KinA